MNPVLYLQEPSYLAEAPADRSIPRWVPNLGIFIAITWLISFPFDFYLSLAILSFAGLAAALIGLFHPTLGLIGIGMVCTVDALTRSLLSEMFRYNTVNYVLLLSVVAGLPLMERMKDTQTRILQGFALLVVLGLAVSQDIVGGMQQVLNVASVFGLTLYYLRARKDPSALYSCALINGVLAGVGGLVFFAQINRLPWRADDAEGRFMNANAFAFFPLAAIFSICLAYPSARPKQQTKLAILSLLTLFSVFLSGSRGAIILGTIALIFLFITTKGASRRFFYLWSIPLLSMTAIALFPELQTYAVQRFLKMFDGQYSLNSRTSGRSDVAAVGVAVFEKHPLGVGTGGFSIAYADADADEMAFAGVAKQAHSGWVKTLVENGVLGVLVLGLYVLSFAATGRRSAATSGAAIGALVTITLAIAFGVAEFQNKGLWILASGATALLNYPMTGMERSLRSTRS